MAISGWLLLVILAGWALPHYIFPRLVTRIPVLERMAWAKTLADRQQALSRPWLDSRPLIVFAGDSQIELGSWYDLFAGRFAVRNAGLSRARIADVTRLLATPGDRRPKAVVLLCGVNDLFAGAQLSACLADYEALLQTVRAHLQPVSIVVLPVLPLRESIVDRASHQFNQTIREFNARLAACCQKNDAVLLDATSVLETENGGLDASYTFDGLHLNAAGYHRLADFVGSKLSSLPDAGS